MVPSFILETHAAAPSSLKDFPVWEKPGYQVNNSVIKTRKACQEQDELQRKSTKHFARKDIF